MSLFYCNFVADVRTLYNKTVLFYFYFSFIAVVRAVLDVKKT